METETKFTKGKWITVWDSYAFEKADAHVVFKSDEPYEKRIIAVVKHIEGQGNEANAILISKAPELFDMVVRLREHLEMLINLTPTSEKRNKLTEDNILALTLIHDIK